MAVIGRHVAVADLGWLQLSGIVVWLLWLLVHLLSVAQFKATLLVLMQWTWSYITSNRSALFGSGGDCGLVIAGSVGGLSSIRNG